MFAPGPIYNHQVVYFFTEKKIQFWYVMKTRLIFFIIWLWIKMMTYMWKKKLYLLGLALRSRYGHECSTSPATGFSLPEPHAWSCLHQVWLVDARGTCVRVFILTVSIFSYLKFDLSSERVMITRFLGRGATCHAHPSPEPYMGIVNSKFN